MSDEMNWTEDNDFAAWLRKQELVWELPPNLDDNTLNLMYKAWVAGYEFGTMNSL